MSRRSVLRFAIPLLLVAGAVGAWMTFRPVMRPLGFSEEIEPGDGTTLKGFTFTDFEGGRRRLRVRAGLGSFDPQGGFKLEGVERIEIDREDQEPLVLKAERGSGSGPEGKRVVRLEGGVEMRDEGAGLLVRLPSIEVDQVQGIARSLGDVEIAAPGWSGKASAAIYGLAKGAKSELFHLEASTVEGATLTAGRVEVDRATGRLVLDGGVDYRATGERLRADSAEIERDSAGRVRRVVANGSVEGTTTREGRAATAWRAAQAEVSWGENGRMERALLRGGAFVEQAPSSLTATQIEARGRADDGFDVAAAGAVVWTGLWGGRPARMQSGTLDATLDGAGAIRSGEAKEGVRFDGSEGGAEAVRAVFTPGEPQGTLTLVGEGTVRARVRSGRTRVVGDRIVASSRGDRLEAEGRVEATLLPDTTGAKAASSPSATGTSLFDGKQTIHFVAGRLESDDSGKRLKFRTGVRGWQEDRTLAADEVDADSAGDSLDARGRVSTRLPRGKGKAASDADYLEVTSEVLAWRGAESTATYTGSVRARLAEGWLETARLVLTQRRPEGGIRDVRAFDGVRLEFTAADEGGMPRPVTGNADRVVWDPGASVVRLFGDRAPAQVRREGDRGGTTAGRVLRYRIDADVVEVESAPERDR